MEGMGSSKQVVGCVMDGKSDCVVWEQDLEGKILLIFSSEKVAKSLAGRE